MLTTVMSKRGPIIGLACVLLLTIIYVANAWTPSSYSLVLNSVGLSKIHPTLGQARGIRSDEYSVQTPHFQMAVLSKFNERETVSPYHETMKSFIAYPIKDWSIIFKPQLWGFFLMPASYAYSAYFSVLSLAFILGWCLFLKMLRIPTEYAAAGSLLLFFSHFIQVWWTTNAASFAFAPWVAIAFLMPKRQVLRALLVLYTTAVWLFGLLYPPFLYGMALVMAAAILAFRPETLRLKNLVITLSAGALAGALVYLDMHDVIEVMRNTVYPGHRSVNGGTAPSALVAATFFPYINTLQFDPSLVRPETINECEAGTVGSFLVLIILCFAEMESIKHFLIKHKRPMLIMLSGIAICLGWILLPIPAAIGHAVLLDMVPPRRLLLAFGFIVQIVAIFMLPHLRWSFSLHRILNFLAVIFIVFTVSKGSLPASLIKHSWFDVAIVPFILVAIHLGKKSNLSRYSGQLLLLASVATNVVTFGTFNPLQSAKPIFSTEAAPAVRDLKDLQAIDTKNRAYINGWYGATLTGLGVRAVNHTPMSPQLSYMKAEFPELPSDVQNQVFNRYSHIIPSFVAEPSVDNDKLFLPLQHFAKNDHLTSTSISDELPWDGSVDSYSILRERDGRYVAEIAGWANFTHVNAQQKIEYSNATITPIGTSRDLRHDVAVAKKDDTMNLAGFRAYFKIPSMDQVLHIELAASDPKNGQSRIPNLTTLSVVQPKDLGTYPATAQGKGYVDAIDYTQISPEAQTISISGWLPFPLKEDQSIQLVTEADVDAASLQRVFRPDLQKQLGQPWAMSGFKITLTRQGQSGSQLKQLCVLISDPTDGVLSLNMPASSSLCKKQ